MDLAYVPDELRQKMHTEDRILVLETTGVQKSLIDTTQELHAIRGPFDNLWRLKYKHGVIPPAFRQTWTSFPQLLRYTTGYFKNRNIKIKEIKDVYTNSNS